MLKDLKEGEEFPIDFWNYRINHILGYRYDHKERNLIKEERKYTR
jgi:hypothetical protein